MTDRHEAECARVEAEFNGTGGNTAMTDALDEAIDAVATASQLAGMRDHTVAYEELQSMWARLGEMRDALMGDHGNTTGL